MKYGKLYAVIAMVGIIVGGYWVINWQANRITTLTDTNKKLTVALEEQKSINTDYQARIMRLNQLDIQYIQELANAKNEISRLRDISERHPERVYIKASCSKNEITPSPAWMMQPPPDLLTSLSEIMSYSESELQSQSR